MKRTKWSAWPMLAALLVFPLGAVAQNEPDAAGDRIESRGDVIPESLRERHAALLERLRNADLRPAQKRRIYNALTDRWADRLTDGRRDRLRDRPRPVRDVRDRPDVKPDVRPDVRPPVRPPRVDTRPASRPRPAPVVRPARVAAGRR